MFRILALLVFALLCSSCQLSPFKSEGQPLAPAPTPVPAAVERVVQIQRPILDFAIESSIEDVLLLNEDQFAGVRVLAKKGIVTLTGTVPYERYKTQLLDVIQNIKGVRRIVDRIEIVPVQAASTGKPESRSSEQSSFPWLAVQIGAAIAFISTVVWAVRRRRPVAHGNIAQT